MKEKNTPYSVTILTMGCRVNQFETDLILKMGLDSGLHTTDSVDDADIIIINTCSVTQESERQARKLIRRLGRDHPKARLVVTGCYAQRSPETFYNQPNVALVVGNQDKKRLWHLWDQNTLPKPCDHPLTEPAEPGNSDAGGIAAYGPILDHSENRARTPLQIQDGCDRHCTYCLIPQVRGPSVSIHPDRIMAQAERYLQAGSRELVLLGIDIGSFGRDLSPPWTLAQMVKALLPLCQTGRLRLSSVDPMDLDDEMMALFAPGSPLCPHLHLSIQSGDDLIRKRMGRQGSRQELLMRINQLRRINPHMVFGADLIAGFPTESDEAFANTHSLIAEGGISLLHVFPYSQRPNTPAARFPSHSLVPEPIVKQRASILRQAGQEQFNLRLKSRLLYPADVLVEKVDGAWVQGTSEDYYSVRFINTLADIHGAMRRVDLTEFDPTQEMFLGVVPQVSTDLSTGSVDKW
ncbi:MAG: tRNA (N(6)-L-threonylcarbamoyladenosine(37)-C(2))-methylthiotransferase MtaB [Nitrospirae bacterium]|nr:tRNA (N(6)-L-threonylcarbamoyladenosine(37)-C(2))-methylthiotransferase MtaB [Magnetococcales bacterium]